MKVELDTTGFKEVERELSQLKNAMRFRITQRASREGAKIFVTALKKAYRALPIKKTGARELARTVRRKAARRRRDMGGATNILVGNARGEGYFWNWVERGTRPHAVGEGSSLTEGGMQSGALHPGMQAYSPIRKTLKKMGQRILDEMAAWIRDGIRRGQ